MCISVLTNTNVMFYNRTKCNEMLMDDYGTTMTEEIFQKIDNMEWTLDYFTGLVSNIYEDVDYLAGRSEGDFYGFHSSPFTPIDNWQFASDIHMVVQDETDLLKLVYNTEKTAILVDKLTDLYWKQNGSYCPAVSDNEQLTAEEIDNNVKKQFASGKALFTPNVLSTCLSTFREMEDNYTILPYPMWDEAQDKYLTGSMDHYSVLTVPKTCGDVDMVSYITEVMNYKSREILFPIYYEETFQKQFSRDPESVEMLDIIMEGRWFDLGTMLHESLDAMAMRVRTLVQTQTSFQAGYTSDSNAKRALKGIVKKFQKNNT